MLSEESISLFRRDGFVRSAIRLDKVATEALSAEADAILRQTEAKDVSTQCHPLAAIERISICKSSFNWKIRNSRFLSLAVAHYAQNPELAREVSQLLGVSSVRLWRDQIVVKPAICAPAVGWHQDSVYWRELSDAHQVTAWIALDDSSKESGCLRMVRASHLWGDQSAYWRTVSSFEAMPNTFRGAPIDFVDIHLPKGMINYHHGHTWHGSYPNRSANPRRALAIHFMSGATGVSGTIAANLDESHFPLVWPAESHSKSFTQRSHQRNASLGDFLSVL